MHVSPEALEYFEWAKKEREKHRTMTAAEYRAWCKVGDGISSPTDTNSFPGGLTILFESDGDSRIIGTTTG